MLFWLTICLQWAPASMFFKQPNPVTITSPDGIKVPFGSSDVKALLIYFTGTYDEAFSTSSYLGEVRVCLFLFCDVLFF